MPMVLVCDCLSGFHVLSVLDLSDCLSAPSLSHTSKQTAQLKTLVRPSSSIVVVSDNPHSTPNHSSRVIKSLHKITLYPPPLRASLHLLTNACTSLANPNNSGTPTGPNRGRYTATLCSSGK
jgi:hypothetical protein